MRLTLHTFQRLPPATQLVCVQATGTLLTQRRGPQGSINLYYLPGEKNGFFAEVGFSDRYDCVMGLRSFGSSAPLEEYTWLLPLPQG